MGRELNAYIGEGIGCVFIAMAIAILVLTVLAVYKYW